MAPKIQLDPRILSSQGDRMDSLKREFDGLFRDVSGTLYDTNYNWSEYLANNFSWKINSAQKSFSAVTSMLESGAEAARNSAATFSSLDDSLAKLFGQGAGADAASGASAAVGPGAAPISDMASFADAVSDMASSAFAERASGAGESSGAGAASDAVAALVGDDDLDAFKALVDEQEAMIKKWLAEHPEYEAYVDIIDFLKSVFKTGGKAGSKESAAVSKAFSYYKSFLDFYMGDKEGWTGAKDLADLADKSCGLWKAFYDYLDDFYKGSNGIFNEDLVKNYDEFRNLFFNGEDIIPDFIENASEKGKWGMFSKSFAKKAEGVGIVGSIFGVISSLCGAGDTISSSNEKGFATTAGEIIGELDSGVDLWGSVLEYIHVNDEAINITTKGANGIYSPLSFYTAIVKGGISTVSQAFKSVGKYSADGKYDLTDAANTGVEASVHGLGSMIDSLTFGLGKYIASGMTLGFISPDEFTADNISAKLENGSADLGEALAWGYDDLIIKATTGTKAGEYIQNDPELKKKFRNAGRIGQAALTFYAAAKSLGQ